MFNGTHYDIASGARGSALLANIYRPCLVEAMRQWFAEIHKRENAKAYEDFAAKVVSCGDTIITFNYDVSLDAKLYRTGKWPIGDGYGFQARGLPIGSAVKLLKLHGSINWLGLLFGGRSSGTVSGLRAFGSRPAFGSDDLAALGYFGLSDPIFPRTSAGVPPMVLPTMRKQFFFETSLGREWESFWNRLWRSARRAIRSSDLIVICGYGMYPIDRRGRDLLLKGEMAGEIEVCCGDDSDRIVQELTDRGRTASKTDQTYFEQWISAQDFSDSHMQRQANSLA